MSESKLFACGIPFENHNQLTMLYVLFEAAIGYSIFEVAESEEIGIELESVQVRTQSQSTVYNKLHTDTGAFYFFFFIFKLVLNHMRLY